MAGFDIDTSLLERKLRAIAKHTEALANELSDIKEEVCPECGSLVFVVVKAYGDSEKVERSGSCNSCGYEMASKGEGVIRWDT